VSQKTELNRAKSDLRVAPKRVQEQMELTLAHKERMKDKELECEQNRFDKAKDNNKSCWPRSGNI
jgi:hypothetical protein